MSMRISTTSSLDYSLLRHLADGEIHSGEQLAEPLGLTRAGIWKRLKDLAGRFDLQIEALPARGYRLRHSLELLEPERLLRAMSPATLASLSELHLLLQVDSTNTWLGTQGYAADTSGVVCLAEHQTAGRGRLGRRWISPFGANVYLSILWHYDLPPVALSGLSLALGLAVIQSLESLGVPGVGLKWPNDLLWQGRKIAGLLLEVKGEFAGPSRIIAGLGVNTRIDAAHGEAIEQAWVDLEHIPGGAGIARNQLVGCLIEALVTEFQRFAREGFAPLVEVWRSHDAYLGQRVQLSRGEHLVEGIEQGVNESGALLLECEGERRSFVGGELSLRKCP